MGSPCESRAYGMNVTANQMPASAVIVSRIEMIRRNQNRVFDGLALRLACGVDPCSVDSGAVVELVTFTS